MTNARIITVEVAEHKGTGLLVGFSKDMKGLYVHGRTEEELEARIPQAIKAILEADGKGTYQVMKVEDDAEELPEAFTLQRSHKFALAIAA